MKTTYLVKQIDARGNTSLYIASKFEWKAIIESNKDLPSEERRYFISDCIIDGNEMDLMVIEVSYEEHRKWNKEHMRIIRNINEGKKYLHLSINASLENNPDAVLSDAIRDPFNVEAFVLEKYNKEEIRSILRKWKTWAEDMFDLYLQDKEKGSAALIAKKYGVSDRMGRKYKYQFENYIKKLIFKFRL